jgi:peptidoglycan/LPS O-acetylase OafA/YrhL
LSANLEQNLEQTSVPGSRAIVPVYLAAGPSVLLDIVRFLAALTVAIGHLSQGIFTFGWPPVLMDFAVGAVSVFFVLSGFMIRYITLVKYGDLRRYAVDRFARIYSVAIPALVVTFLLEALCAHLNPAFYAANFSHAGDHLTSRIHLVQIALSQPWTKGLIRTVATLTMLAESWFQDVVPLFNSPFWSLSYECVYYALFGVFLYMRGTRRFFAYVLVFLLVGPTILLMFPLWLLGCAAYDAYQNGFWKRASLVKLIGFSLLSFIGVHGSNAFVQHFHPHHVSINRVVPYMDYAAIATVAILLPLCIAARNLRLSEKSLPVRMIRRVAAATYPLYLIHFPMFALLAAVVPYPRASLWAKLALLSVALAAALALSGPCDRLTDYLRASLMRPNRA